MTRADIVSIARSYILTPFHHQGRLPGVGLDCAGVIICIGRAIGTVAPDFDVRGYGRTPDGHTMGELCDRHLLPVSREQMEPGDVLVAAISYDPQHVGILGNYRHGGVGEERLSLIHAAQRSNGTGVVVETRLMFSENLKFVAAYRYPGID